MYGLPVPSALFSFPLRGDCSLELLWSPCIAMLAVNPMELDLGASCQRCQERTAHGSEVPEYSTAYRASAISSCQQVPRSSWVRDTTLSRFEAVLNCTGRSNHACWPPGLEAEKNLLPKPDTLQSWVECSLVEARDPAQKSVQMFPFHVAWYCNILPWF